MTDLPVEEAVDYLSGLGKYSNRAEYPLPSLILLDIKMPGLDGLEVLRWVRSQPGLKTIRVVMLTTSSDIRDVNTAYQLGANSFLTKPVRTLINRRAAAVASPTAQIFIRSRSDPAAACAPLQ